MSCIKYMNNIKNDMAKLKTLLDEIDTILKGLKGLSFNYEYKMRNLIKTMIHLGNQCD